MLKRLVIAVVVLGGAAVLADRGLAMAAGNATAHQVRIHEGLKEDPSVEYRGFPFVSQALRGRFRAVDVTARDVVRGGLTIDRIDAHLEGVRIKLDEALKGRVGAVPIREGSATVLITYNDLQAWLAGKPGATRFEVRGADVVAVSTFGVPGAGEVTVEGTPKVTVANGRLRVSAANVRATAGSTRLSATLAAQAAARMSFVIPLTDLPFGITIGSARLTGSGLVVDAAAEGLVIDVNS